MDLGNLFEKLEEDSRSILVTTAICFPIAYLDCWKMSAHFSTIELIPQIILSVGIATLIALGGILFNIFYLVASDKIDKPIYPFISIMPCYVTSIPVILLNHKLTPLSFEFVFIGFCLCSLAQALISRGFKNRQKKKSSCKSEDDSEDT